RDPKFYYEDGNIVLSAKNADGCTRYFRLHRSILAKNSVVFGDMFTMPPPPSGTDLHDGVPLVEMAGDSAEALHSLVALLYDPQCISVILEDEHFAAHMHDPVVIARKYQVEWVCSMAAARLRSQWPLTLVDWDRFADAEVSDAVAAEDSDSWRPGYQLQRLPEPVTAIRLARMCDVPEILPVAFLHLMRQPLDPETHPEDILWEVPARELLDLSDSNRLFVARERIGQWVSVECDIPWLASKVCKTPIACELGVATKWCMMLSRVGRDGNMLAASDWVIHGERLHHICPLCSVTLRDETRKKREDFFSELAAFFQL
ncbi:hypothetical protein C8R46DRAFT_1241422, partial [Mycena filopes]